MYAPRAREVRAQQKPLTEPGPLACAGSTVLVLLAVAFMVIIATDI
jgi:hypothetical protein